MRTGVKVVIQRLQERAARQVRLVCQQTEFILHPERTAGRPDHLSQIKVRTYKLGTVRPMLTPSSTPLPPAVPVELLARMDTPGPRYTSYPTADRFNEAFDANAYRGALRQLAQGAVAGGGAAALSVYVHVPFCESVCYYCACNKVITRHHERATEYLAALRTEINLHVKELGAGRTVSQLHLGGGSPTFLSDGELTQLISDLRAAFNLLPSAELSIEVDPRTADTARLQALRQLGFNRLSFGIQDFEPSVQKAVHRIQPEDQVGSLMQAARALKFDSINADLIYGLPLQTAESFARTIAKTIALRPDRIALYAYAHLPQRFKPQRRIDAHDLPSAKVRIDMLGGAITAFMAAGYVYVGMDHFALPEDALGVAKRQGRLHRNFQGYSTQPDCDLVALGVSAIGRIGATYSQNAKTLDEYYDALRQGEFPVVRGLALTRDDIARRAIIMAIMCQGRVEFESIELAHLLQMKTAFPTELAHMKALAEQGLVEVDDHSIQVTPKGWYFVRAVAMTFDKHLQADRTRERFSRII
jgi:oxygen-independent coproporphyrinogen III oxidase